MSQVAQQDYIRIPVADFSNTTESERASIKERVEQGTILDAYLEDADGRIARVIGVDETSGYVYIPNIGTEEIIGILFDE